MAPARRGEEIEQWAREDRLQVRRKLYESNDLDGANIVIALA